MARAKKDGEFINCKIRQDIADGLNNYSKRTMIPKTAIVEKALEEYLDKDVHALKAQSSRANPSI